MVKLADMPVVGRGFIAELEMPVFEQQFWVDALPPEQRRVSIVSTAAFSRRGEKPFSGLAKDDRTINKDDRDLVMTHAAVEYDRNRTSRTRAGPAQQDQDTTKINPGTTPPQI